MMMTSRSDLIKDRLIHNQSPFPTKDKVLSFTIPVDHTETLLFCSSSSDSSGPSSNNGAKNGGGGGGANPDNDALNFIGTDDDPCTGRDSLASFLDEGLGTSLDGVDEVTSPIFSSLGRNESVEEIVCWKGSICDVGGGESPSPRINDILSDSSSPSSSSASTTEPLITNTSTFQLVPSRSSNGKTATISTIINCSGGLVESQIISPTSPKYINGETCKTFTLTIPEPGTVKLYASEEEIPPPPPPLIVKEANTEELLQHKSSGSGSTKKGNSNHSRNKNMPLGRQGPQKCTICEKTFSNASALTKHKLTHSDERRHACATCGKAFKRQDHLNGHMLTHRNKKPFECQSKGCGKSYCDARSLRRHVENRHGHEVLESMNLTSSHNKHGNNNNNNNKNKHGSNSNSSNKNNNSSNSKPLHNHQHQSSNNNSSNGNGNGKASQQNQQHQEPQPELSFVPIKLEYSDIDMEENEEEKCSSISSAAAEQPLLAEAKPQIIMEGKSEKHNKTSQNPLNLNGEVVIPTTTNNNNSQQQTISLHKAPAAAAASSSVLQKFCEPTTAFVYPREGVPVVIKKENISVFDFDENLEDESKRLPSYNNNNNIAAGASAAGSGNGTAFPLTSPTPSSSSPNTSEKLVPTTATAAVKLNSLLDNASINKFGNLADIKLIQEWAKKLGDSKVALLLSSTTPSSISSANGSLQLSKQGFAFDSATGAMTASGGSHAFIPTSENGIFSVTPISIVPTSSNEFSVKGAAEIFMANPSGDSPNDSPKPFYILPTSGTQHLFPPTLSSTAAAPNINNNNNNNLIKVHQSKTINNNNNNSSDQVKSNNKSEPSKTKEANKSHGIGAVLANRIKSKLKAGNLKKLGKIAENGHGANAKHSHTKRSSSTTSSTSIVNDPPVLEVSGSEQNGGATTATTANGHGFMVISSSELSPRQDLNPSGPIVMTKSCNNNNNNDHTASSSNVGGANGWCESPKEAMEEDRLSDGGEGDDKPVECTICCRKFKNTPALNGHMRLHGGYFKKESEGTNKKKETSKDNNHGTPLQTVSVSVRALIEEKIKERRNNLLKLAAAAEAEKAAKAAGKFIPTENLSSSTKTSGNNDKSSSKSEKHSATSNKSSKSSETKANMIAQQQQQQAETIKPLKFTNVNMNVNNKLNPEYTSEKDKTCDQILINDNNSRSLNNSNNNNNLKLNKSSKQPILINNTTSATAITNNVNLDTCFQDATNTSSVLPPNSNILLGGNSVITAGGNVGGITFINGINHSAGATAAINDLIMPQLQQQQQQQQQQQLLLRDSIQSSSLSLSSNSSPDLTFPSLLDCGINPSGGGVSSSSSCPTYHIIYVDSNGDSIPLAVDAGTLGKVAELFPSFASSTPKTSTPLETGNSLIDELNLDGFTKSSKDNSNSLMGSQSFHTQQPIQANVSDDPSSLLFEWRNSISSDNTDTSFGLNQECARSFLYSSSSDNGIESTKDPVAAGRGYCYTPILSPNSSFCLTPGPDSPFEVSSQNQSLSFICPSPTIGDGPAFHYSSIPSIGNPPSSVEQIFSPEQPQQSQQTAAPPPQQPSNFNNITFSNGEIQKPIPLYQNSQQKLPPQNSSSYFGEFDKIPELNSKEFLSLSQITPFLEEQQQTSIKTEDSDVIMDCLPPITSFPNIVNAGAFSTNGKYENSSENSKDLMFQCHSLSNNNGSNSNLLIQQQQQQPQQPQQQQQQTYIPFEVFTLSPIPSKISDKWINGKFDKAKKIHVGPDYQAVIPSLIIPPNKKSKRGRCMDEKLWDPSVLNSSSSAELENYLEFACCSAVPGGGRNKEYALHLLMLSKGNIREAILRLMEKLPTLPPKLKSYSYVENQRWTSEEIISFQISLFQVGKDFSRIAKSIGTKSREECSSFYYFWKKVCVTQYHVMKQIWRGRLEHQQLQMSQENCNNLLDLISNSNGHNHQGSFRTICSGI